MGSLTARSRLPRLAALLALALVLFSLTPGAARGTGREAGVLRLLGQPRQVAARERGDLVRLVGRASGGFLLGYTRGESLLVGEHAADGSREAVHRLGSLGYAGGGNLRSLEPLGPRAFVATWDVDHHYAGLLSSHRAVVDGPLRHVWSSTDGRAPVLVGDGTGGAIGFFARGGATFFGRWDGSGRSSRRREIRGTGEPLQALPFRGGVLLAAARQSFDESQVEWWTASGRRLESARGHRGWLVANGQDVIGELVRSHDGRRLLARFGASPTHLGTLRPLVGAPVGTLLDDVTMAINQEGEAVLAWSIWPEQAACGVWAQAFDVDGEPLTGVLCAAGPGADRPVLLARPDGRFWFAWRTNEPYGASLLARIWLRPLEVATPGRTAASGQS
jgi:hypothetical protein